MIVLALAAALFAAPPPDWQAPPDGAFPQSMAVTGVVEIGGVELRSSSDRVAAFIGGEIRGVAAPQLVGSRRVFFLSVAGQDGDGAVSFQAYDAAADQVVDVGPGLAYAPTQPVGTPSAPFVWAPLTGGPPPWSVNPSAFENSITLTVALRDRDGTPVEEDGTLVAAFVGDQVRGVAPVVQVSTLGGRAFLLVYGGQGTEPLTFKVYRPSVDRTFGVVEGATFRIGGDQGTVSAPVLLTLQTGQVLTGAEGWRMLAPPGDGTSVETYLASLWTQGFPGADVAQGTASVYSYDEPLGQYVVPTAASDAWTRGTGRFVYVWADDDPGTPGVQGFPKPLPDIAPPGSGPFTFDLSRTPGNGEPEGAGWNLLGNPYAEAIAWDQGWTRSDLSGAVYVWDPNYLGGGYRSWNGTAGALQGGVVPSGNAFWVEATGSAPTATVTEAAQVGAATLLGRRALSGLRLAVTSDDRPGLGAEVFVSFQADAQAGIDASDAWVLPSLASDHLVLGAVHGDRMLAIDARPADESVEIELAVRAVESGAGRREALRLSWPDVALPPGWRATLVDTETGAAVDLAAASDYRFTVAGSAPGRRPTRHPTLSVGRLATPGPARFHLRLSASGVASEASPGALVADPPFPNPARGATTLAFRLAQPTHVRAVLVDALGQTVALLADGARGAGGHRLHIPLDGVAAGVYTVWITAGAERLSQRLAVVR